MSIRERLAAGAPRPSSAAFSPASSNPSLAPTFIQNLTVPGLALCCADLSEGASAVSVRSDARFRLRRSRAGFSRSEVAAPARRPLGRGSARWGGGGGGWGRSLRWVGEEDVG